MLDNLAREYGELKRGFRVNELTPKEISYGIIYTPVIKLSLT